MGFVCTWCVLAQSLHMMSYQRMHPCGKTFFMLGLVAVIAIGGDEEEFKTLRFSWSSEVQAPRCIHLCWMMQLGGKAMRGKPKGRNKRKNKTRRTSGIPKPRKHMQQNNSNIVRKKHVSVRIR